MPDHQGLYDPAFEHDACGVSFVVDVKGRASHAIIERGLTALCNLQHRGASGSEPNTGDGAGILIQVPDRFLRAVAGCALPPAGAYADRDRVSAPRYRRSHCRGQGDRQDRR